MKPDRSSSVPSFGLGITRALIVITLVLVGVLESPGMFAQVDLSRTTGSGAIVVPSDVLIVRAEGTLVAIVRPDHTVHLQKIEVGRDYGDKIEILRGVVEGDTLVVNPGDAVREGATVEPVSPETQ